MTAARTILILFALAFAIMCKAAFGQQAHRVMKPATVVKGATLQMAISPNSSVSQSLTNIMLTWDSWTNVFQRIESTTNLSQNNWQIVTNLYPIWPTNVVLPNNQPQQFFRHAVIYAPK